MGEVGTRGRTWGWPATLVAAATLLLVACGEPSDPAASPPSSAAPASNAAQAPSSTSTVAPLDLAALPPCGGLSSYRTVPDWVPGVVPDGLALEYANTTVNLATDGAPGDGTSVAFTLIESDPTGRFVADLQLDRTDDLAQFQVDPPHMPGFAADDAAGRLDSVRSLPGRVVREINRGDTWGWSEARWIEDGAGWTASSRALDVAALVAALEPLLLNADGVEDPQGRFQVVGRGPVVASRDLRDTEIGIGPTGSPSRSTPPVKVSVTPVAEGSEGLVSLQGIAEVPPTFRVDTHVSEVGGRLLLSNGATTMTSLEDGTNVRVQVVGGPSGVELAREDVIDLIGGLRRSGGDAHPFTGPLVPGWWSVPEPGAVPEGFCREANG